MADRMRVSLHIGAPKTGTTYLQRVLTANREQLAANGVLYPSVGGDAHHRAAWGLRPDGGQRIDGSEFRDHWDQLVEQVGSWPGPAAVISSEMFVFFGAARAATVRNAFGDAEVHVVYSARDLIRQVPAVWQEQVKNQRTQSYGSFVLDLLGPRSTSLGRHFWRAQDAPKALERWCRGLPPSRVHVVTAPPAGSAPTVLWERFAAAIGIDAGDYEATVLAANTSLGVASSEVLRRYNARHAGGLPIRQYRRQVLGPLMPALLGSVADPAKLSLSGLQQRLLARRSRKLADGIRAAGYDVVGSLDDLTPPLPARSSLLGRGRSSGHVTDAEVVDALLDVVRDLLATQRRLERRARRRPPIRSS